MNTILVASQIGLLGGLSGSAGIHMWNPSRLREKNVGILEGNVWVVLFFLGTYHNVWGYSSFWARTTMCGGIVLSGHVPQCVGV